MHLSLEVMVAINAFTRLAVLYKRPRNEAGKLMME
jgi:hypothetical protein